MAAWNEEDDEVYGYNRISFLNCISRLRFVFQSAIDMSNCVILLVSSSSLILVCYSTKREPTHFSF